MERGNHPVYQHTERVKKHIPCGYAWTLVSDHSLVPSRVEYFKTEISDFIVDDGESEEDHL